jgi:hypothetical protein
VEETENAAHDAENKSELALNAAEPSENVDQVLRIDQNRLRMLHQKQRT